MFDCCSFVYLQYVLGLGEKYEPFVWGRSLCIYSIKGNIYINTHTQTKQCTN